MAKNEKTSPRVAKLASKGLKGKKLTTKQQKSVHASALTQAADKKKKAPPSKPPAKKATKKRK